MKKALEILNQIYIDDRNTLCIPSNFSPLDVFNAIQELEEAMKHKTCKGCVHEVGDMQDLHCAFCSRSCDDNFEPKDTQC